MTTRRVKDGTAGTARARKRAAGSRAVTGGALVEGASWREGYNPTKRLTVERAVWLMECYSRGMFAELMWLFGAPYMGIEKKDSVYLAIIERRVAAVRQMDWSVRVDDEDADDPRAKLQKAALEDAYGKIGNLGKAVEALEMATFRGFAHLAITPDELVVVQPWNVQRDGCTGGWRFNPGAQDCGWEALGPEMDMRPEEHVTREVERPVGAVALVKWLRSNLSEKDWDAFIEVYGLPAWLIVGPPNIPEDKVEAYQTAAEKIARGGSGYLPNGSSAQCADSPRAGAPFGDRLRYLNEMLVIAGTGGMLTMLAESGSGTLAGNAHADAFATLARMDAADISECFQRQFDRRALEAAGLLAPGERAKAWFTLDFKSEPDVGETVQQIQGLSSAGYEVDPAQVAELTGYRVTRKETPAQPVPGGWGGLRLANARAVGRTAAPRPDGDGAEAELAAALQRDLKPAGKVIAEALKTRDWSEAKKRLAGILKECGTESAKVLEGAMKKAGEETAAKGEEKEGLTRSRGGAERETVTAAIANPCPDCHRNMPKDGPCSFCAKRKANHEAGKAAYEKISKDHQDVVGAMERDSIGKIDFIWGKRGTKENDYEDGEGFDKILFKHKATAAALPGVIAYGDIYESQAEPKYYIVKKRYVAVLRKRTGSNHYLITGFKADDPNYVAKIRKECTLVEKGDPDE